jgi:hypothetical protein
MALLLLALFLSHTQLQGMYRGARKKFKANRPMAVGVVTDPALLPTDRFGWFHGLVLASVQLPAGEQMAVYFPEGSEIPDPGQKVAIFEWGTWAGKPRHIGLLYAPQMFVVQGVRE